MTDYEDVNGGAISLEGTDFTVEKNLFEGNQYAAILLKGALGRLKGIE
ncbi:MAG: hypothetical protein MZV49_01060 [Rhodopseudomonas palustris]|nr:hypothetical protein [Rhodopseudomonas palustris]